MRQLPPLSALRAFDATARLGSVTRAAEELGRTHGAVSRQLRSLQDHLGGPLFDKAGAGLRLNAQGIALQPVVAEAKCTLYRSRPPAPKAVVWVVHDAPPSVLRRRVPPLPTTQPFWASGKWTARRSWVVLEGTGCHWPHWA